MRRHSLILLLAGAVGCAGKASVQPSTQPSPQVSTATPKKTPAPPAVVPAPGRIVPLDSNQVSEIARDVNLSADSAADEAVLDQLAVAHPDVPASDDELPAVPVSWDIDVTTWGDHERVQFYLSFFEEQAHPRLPDLDRADAGVRADDPPEAPGGQHADRPRVPGPDRERLLQLRHQPHPCRRHVAVHAPHRQGIRPPHRQLGGRAA